MQTNSLFMPKTSNLNAVAWHRKFAVKFPFPFRYSIQIFSHFRSQNSFKTMGLLNNFVLIWDLILKTLFQIINGKSTYTQLVLSYIITLHAMWSRKPHNISVADCSEKTKGTAASRRASRLPELPTALGEPVTDNYTLLHMKSFKLMDVAPPAKSSLFQYSMVFGNSQEKRSPGAGHRGEHFSFST